MWHQRFEGFSSASPAAVHAVLTAPARWREWNPGVERIEMSGAFEPGTHAVMVFPDGSSLPFSITWVEPERGYEDLTEIADAGVSVRVRHELSPLDDGGTRIVYECTATGPDDAAQAIGEGASEDFAEVISALAAYAEQQASHGS